MAMPLVSKDVVDVRCLQLTFDGALIGLYVSIGQVQLTVLDQPVAALLLWLSFALNLALQWFP